MKKIVLLSVYGDCNIGDQAILQSTISVLHVTHGFCDLTLVCVDPDHVSIPPIHASKFNYKKILTPYGYAISTNGKNHRVTKIFRFIEIIFGSIFVLLFRTSILSASPKYRYINEIFHADYVYSIGGGYLRTKKQRDYFGLILTILPFMLTTFYKKHVVLLPMSFGNFLSTVQANIAAFSIRHSHVFLREQNSYDTMTKTYWVPKNITFSPDLAFYLPQPTRADGNTVYENYVVLTAREWLSPKGQKTYEQVLIQVINYLYSTYKLITVFIPMSNHFSEDNDIAVYNRLSGYLGKEKIKLYVGQTPEDIQLVLRSAKFSICTRMHSSILSFSVGVPFISIMYEHKTEGVHKMLGLEQWYFDISKIRLDTMTQMIDKLMDQEIYLRYKNTIKIRSEHIKEKESELLEQLKNYKEIQI